MMISQKMRALLFTTALCVFSTQITIAAPAGSNASTNQPAQTEVKMEKIRPAVIYDMATKFDKAFNESVFNGLKKFKEDTGTDFKEYQITNESQSEQFIRQMAKNGHDIIIAVGFSQIPALQKVAPEYPNTKFVLLDAVLDLPNVQSIAFKEHEGTYLVGALAAMKTKSKKLGFIGGMDIPLIRKFGCGYEQGAKSIDKQIDVVQNTVGDTPQAWKDPTKAGEIANSQMDRGVDVIYTAAGQSSLGVLQSVADREGKFAIGTDTNQNGLFPGKVLTSMIKRLDNATYESLKSATMGTWKPGVMNLGLKENGVDWVLDDHNKSIITDEMKTKVDDLRAKIVSGEIKVVDYTTENACKY